MYRIRLESSVENDLKRIPAKDFHHIVSHIKALAENPRPSGCRKLIGFKNDWRVRIGDYRVVYEINDEEKSVNVIKVKLRSIAYR
jgi:mRNA interferase RelE/StbE